MALPRRHAAGVVLRKRAQAQQRVGQELAVTQFIEIAAQDFIAGGQHFHHHCIDRVLPGAKAQRLGQRRMHGDAGRVGDVRGLGVGARLGIHAIDHPAQQMRMDGADHGVLCGKAAAIDQLDATGAPIGHLDARDVGIGQHLAAMFANAGDQCIGELAGAATGHAESIGFEEAQEHVHANGRGLLHQARPGFRRPRARSACARARSRTARTGGRGCSSAARATVRGPRGSGRAWRWTRHWAPAAHTAKKRSWAARLPPAATPCGRSRHRASRTSRSRPRTSRGRDTA